MAPKLVVCCDGTWNTPRSSTNVLRTYSFLWKRLGMPQEETPGDGVRSCRGLDKQGNQVSVFYDKGVGTSWFERLPGGATGMGLSKNVRDAYHFLANHFTPRAEIYVFGFSRGAYTARSLCGFISAAGLLRSPTEADVWRAYIEYYALGPHVTAGSGHLGVRGADEWFRNKLGALVGETGRALKTFPRHEGVSIRFIGVYDTVGALGIPLPEAAEINEPIVGFHDTSLCKVIEHAVHALAVDEQRAPYQPTLWTLLQGQALAQGQSVLQVWFPGVHSDIGGGYRDTGIGDITFDFMMRQAAQRGLALDPEQPYPTVALEPLPAQHESFNPQWQTLAQRLDVPARGERHIGPTVNDANGQPLALAGDVRLHRSVVDRFGKDVTVILDEHTDGPPRTVKLRYQPANVSANALPVFAS